MIQLAEKTKCTGCCACMNTCRTGALRMEPDETGFLFPVITSAQCVECGACVRACPALNTETYTSEKPRAFVAQNLNDEIRRQSTSGGAFTGIAAQIIAQGGVVFGAVMGEGCKVNHAAVETEAELASFRSSKYVQSTVGDTFSQAEQLLNRGRLVCYSGTPCQIHGLKKYLKRAYDNLITVDVMCRAVPSPKVLEAYLAYQRERVGEFDRIVFRDKARGYSYSCVTLYKADKALYRAGSESDPWLRLFLGGYCNREACHDCAYQTGARASDITMWDCWGTERYAPEWDDNKGTTNLIAWTAKGAALINHHASGLRVKEIGIGQIDASLQRRPLNRPAYDRVQFFQDVDELTPQQLMQKYVPLTGKVRMKRAGRRLIHALHLHNAVRKTIHMLRKMKRRMY